MRNARSGLVLVVAAALCAPAAAEGEAPEKHELRKPSRWSVGESVTETETLETVTSATLVDEQGNRRALPRAASTLRSTVVRKCLATDEAGRPTKMLLYVRGWDCGGPEDGALEGVVLELRKDGWTFLNRDLELPPRARAWLVGDLLMPASSGEEAHTGLLSATPVAVGESWKPSDGGYLDRILGRFGFAGQRAVEATCTLKSVAPTPAGASATVTFEAAGSTELKAPAPGEGSFRSDVKLSGDVACVPGAWQRTARTVLSAEIRIETNAPDAGRLEVQASSRSTSVHEPGGEIPSWEPEAPDEDATLCEFGTTPLRVGDTFTEIGSDDFKVTTRSNDCAPDCPTPQDERSTEWTLVRRCVEVAADGRPVRERVYVGSWEYDDGKTKDTSLTGRHLDVTAEGAKLVVDATAEGAPISDAAKKWIAGLPAAGRERPLPLAPRPGGSARVGTRWMPETLDAARTGLWNEGFSLEPDHATGRARIVEAAEAEGGTTAKVTFRTQTPVHGTVGKGLDIFRALAGSEVRVSGTVSGPVGAWGRLGERSIEVQFIALGTTEEGPAQLTTTRNVYLDVQPGGEWPSDTK